MARTKSDRRRKNRPSSAAEAPSSSWLSVMLFVGFALSLLHVITISNEDSMSPRDAMANQQKGRRFLANDEEQNKNSPKNDENVWDRKLRVRKDQNQKQSEPKTSDNVWSRSMAAAAIEAGDDRDLDSMKRRLPQEQTFPTYEDKHHFEECIGRSVPQCQSLIDTYVSANPEEFNNQTTLLLDIRKIRELTDASYYKVVLRTDMEGEHVAGIFDDGQVFYPWPWTVHEKDLDIGPWDCKDMETPECCRMIQEDVPDPDDVGNFLACFVEEPVGTTNNPARDDRAITIIDGEGMVVRAPIAH
mmetsp:Transcript_39190/g.81973  ORF Transcript_39190/g.81973 Transcript_39190/m.81973 type:complete len:301 (+) Transcript_39190:86-988(+)